VAATIAIERQREPQGEPSTHSQKEQENHFELPLEPGREFSNES